MVIETNLRGSGRPASRGFTLIELLVVVIILGILSAIAVLGIRGFTTQAARTACQTDWKAVSSAIQSYQNDQGTSAGLTLDVLQGLVTPTPGASSTPTPDKYLDTYAPPAAAANPAPPYYFENIIYGNGYKITVMADPADATRMLPAVSVENQDGTWTAFVLNDFNQCSLVQR